MSTTKKTFLSNQTEENTRIPTGSTSCYSVQDVAGILGVTRQTVCKLIRQKVIPGKQLGNIYRIPKDQFNDWLHSQT